MFNFSIKPSYKTFQSVQTLYNRETFRRHEYKLFVRSVVAERFHKPGKLFQRLCKPAISDFYELLKFFLSREIYLRTLWQIETLPAQTHLDDAVTLLTLIGIPASPTTSRNALATFENRLIQTCDYLHGKYTLSFCTTFVLID